MNLIARKKLLEMFLEQARESGNLELERTLVPAIRQLDEELTAADPEPHRLAREGREGARALQLGRGTTAPVYGDASKAFNLLKEKYSTSQDADERGEILGVMKELEPELPGNLVNEFVMLRASEGSGPDRLHREGAQLARTIQPRKEAL